MTGCIRCHGAARPEYHLALLGEDGPKQLQLQTCTSIPLPLHFVSLEHFLNWLRNYDVKGEPTAGPCCTLNGKYEAVVSKDGSIVKVGCQLFESDKVLALGAKIDELYPV